MVPGRDIVSAANLHTPVPPTIVRPRGHGIAKRNRNPGDFNHGSARKKWKTLERLLNSL
jgi:hypothetical protein